MIHALFLIAIVIGSCLLPLAYKDKSKARNAQIVYITILLFLFAALRGPTVGTDVPAYVKDFNEVDNYEIDELMKAKSERDPVFSLLLRFLALFSDSAQIMLVTVGFVVAVAFGYFAYHQSANPIVLTVFFISFRVYAFTLTGLRQALAMSFCLIALVQLQKKRNIAFFVFTAIGILFHLSAIVFLLSFVLYKIGKPLAVICAMTLFSIIDMLTEHWMVKRIAILLTNERFDNYLDEGGSPTSSAGGTLILYILMFAFVFVSLFVVNVNFKNKEEFNKLFSIGVVAFFVFLMSQSVSILFRISNYFIIPFYAATSTTLNSFFKPKDRVWVNALVVLLLGAQYIILAPGAGITDYYFFWQ